MFSRVITRKSAPNSPVVAGRTSSASATSSSNKGSPHSSFMTAVPKQMPRQLASNDTASSSGSTSSTRTWLLRIFLVASLASLVWFQIPAAVYLSGAATSFYGDGYDKSPTLTLRASISAEISARHSRKRVEPKTLSEEGLLDDCKLQSSLVDDTYHHPHQFAKDDTSKHTSGDGNEKPDDDDASRPFPESSCGALWSGQTLEEMSLSTHEPTRIHVVVSFCEGPLDWLETDLEELIQDTSIADMTVKLSVFSKCNQDRKVKDVFKKSTTTKKVDVQVYSLPKKGSHHHVYAYWMANHAQKEKGSDYVFFLNDTDRKAAAGHNYATNYNSLVEMLRVASNNGFACGMNPVQPTEKKESTGSRTTTLSSAYHCTDEIRSFEMKWCPPDLPSQSCDRRNFASEKYATLGAFVDDLLVRSSSSPEFTDAATASFPMTSSSDIPLMQVCYGDAFAVHHPQILKNDVALYESLVERLGARDSITLAEEDLFVERTWAGLLSEPLGASAVSALRKFGTTCSSEFYHRGVLERLVVVEQKEESEAKKKSAQKMVNVGGALYPEAVAAVISKRKASSSGVTTKDSDKATTEPKMVMVRGALYPEAVAAVIGRGASKAVRQNKLT